MENDTGPARRRLWYSFDYNLKNIGSSNLNTHDGTNNFVY